MRFQQALPLSKGSDAHSGLAGLKPCNVSVTVADIGEADAVIDVWRFAYYVTGDPKQRSLLDATLPQLYYDLFFEYMCESFTIRGINDVMCVRLCMSVVSFPSALTLPSCCSLSFYSFDSDEEDYVV